MAAVPASWRFSFFAFFALFWLSVPASFAAEARAIPTFHCLGLYWSPEGGSPERAVQVRYRAENTTEWQQALPMRYHPIEGTEEDIADYRGSIVHLKPGTSYEVELTLENTSTSTHLTTQTWSEKFPAGEATPVPSSNKPLVIKDSGTPEAWRVYDGTGSTIDVQHREQNCVIIEASYVIVRGLTLKGAGIPDKVVRKERGIGAIDIKSGHHIVIENCDVSDWGRLQPLTGFGVNLDSAILARNPEVSQVIIQRCKLHHPATDSNNWFEPKPSTHPAGPQAISFFDTNGNHVIRFNEMWSDMDHMFNDVIGGAANGSYRGAPGPDSDIYSNFISHCWDDGLEIEGGNRNVRVWDNYITQAVNMIGNAATSIGPIYYWRNVVSRCQMKPDSPGLGFLKMGFAGGEKWMTGTSYIFHNTLFGPEEWLPTGGFGGNRVVKYTVSRNNILQVRTDQNRSISQHEHNTGNDFNFDLFNGTVPEGHETKGIRGKPIYEPTAAFDPQTLTGNFRLTPTSPGASAGQTIPNFSPAPTPDIGAHQRGTPNIIYGTKATQR